MPREVVHDHTGQKASGLGVSGEAIYPSEVLERHGVGGNAEILIAAVREHNPPELQAASAKKIEGDLTRKLRAGELDVDVNEIAGEGATVMDKVVRGTGSVVYSATDAQGTLYKGTFELSDPEGTHVSQAEILTREGSIAASVINPKREARNAAIDNAQRTLDAREKALAARERELLDREEAILKAADAAETAGDAIERGREESEAAAEGGDQGSGDDGNGPERPAALPANYDELNKDDAAKAVAKLDGDDRDAALAYERANKNRKTVTGDD